MGERYDGVCVFAASKTVNVKFVKITVERIESFGECSTLNPTNPRQYLSSYWWGTRGKY
jgi:hypothetical protein